SLREEEKRHDKNLYEKNSYSLVFQHIFLQHNSLRTASVFSTTAAAAEAVCIIRNHHVVSPLNPQDVVGTAARHSVKIQCIQCILWFLSLQ
ncbi:MAG: hypothetical protein IKN52_14430, partial [Victivallales bacterium]|nr:hypothetical protein [Victivallales bacterium]